MNTEDEGAQGIGSDPGLAGLADDIEVAGVLKGLEVATPAPVGGDEGAAEGTKPFRQGESGSGERKLEADEVNGEEGGALGGWGGGGDGQAGGAHGEGGQKEDAKLIQEAAGEAADGLHEPSHPAGLNEAEEAELQKLRRDVGGGGKASAEFLSEDVAFLSDLAGAVIRSDEGEENDLEHGQAGDEGGGLEGFLQVKELFLEGAEDICLQREGLAADLWQAAGGEDGDEEREGQYQRDVEDDLTFVPPEEAGLPGEEGRELPEASGGGHGFDLERGVRRGWRRRGWLGVQKGEVHILGLIDAKELGDGGDAVGVEQGVVVAVVHHAPAVEEHDGVAVVEIIRRMGDEDDGLAHFVGEVAQPDHHFLIGEGVEAGGEFVEEEEIRVADELLGEGHAAHLTAGEGAVFLRKERGDASEIRNVVGPGVAAFAGDGTGEAEGGGGGEIFGDGELRVKGTKLREISYGEGQVIIEVLDGLAGEEDLAGGGLNQAGEGLDEGALPTTGGPDDGDKFALLDLEINAGEEMLLVALLADGDGEIPDADGDGCGRALGFHRRSEREW